MHIHLPKPLHGWRALLGEIGVVFVGIVLALGAESLLQDYHWHQQVTVSEQAIKGELEPDAFHAYERLLVQPCLRGQLSRLAAALNSRAPHWTGMPMAVTNPTTPEVASAPQDDRVLPASYRPPNRTMTEVAWRNAISVGALDHMNPDRVAQLSAVYANLETWRDSQDEEARAAARLAPLAFDGSMDQGRRSDMIAALADVDRLNTLIAIVSAGLINDVRALHLGYSRSDLTTDQGQFYPDVLVKSQREYRGSCVRADLKFDLG
jgi:hypothetical protein